MMGFAKTREERVLALPIHTGSRRRLNQVARRNRIVRLHRFLSIINLAFPALSTQALSAQARSGREQPMARERKKSTTRKTTDGKARGSTGANASSFDFPPA